MYKTHGLELPLLNIYTRDKFVHADKDMQGPMFTARLLLRMRPKPT